MKELTQIDTAGAHTCGKPRAERWKVLEPVEGRWFWLRVYLCCGQVLEEPLMEADVRLAA